MFVSTDSQKVEQQLFERLVAARTQIYAELSKTIVGQREVIDQILISLFAGGHCLITGAPGLAVSSETRLGLQSGNWQ